MTKMNVFTHFFLEILHFKEFCNLIGKQHFGPKLKNQNFVRYGIGVEISITTLFLTTTITRLYPRKTNDKISQKSQKTLIWGHFPNFPKKRCQFLHTLIIYHRAKKLSINYPFLDGQTDKQTDNGDFIGYSTGLGSNSYNKMYYYKGSRNA